MQSRIGLPTRLGIGVAWATCGIFSLVVVPALKADAPSAPGAIPYPYQGQKPSDPARVNGLTSFINTSKNAEQRWGGTMPSLIPITPRDLDGFVVRPAPPAIILMRSEDGEVLVIG